MKSTDEKEEKMNKFGTIAGASVMAIALGAGVVGSATAASAAPKDKAGHSQDRKGDRVTGPEAQQAIDAALAAVPGTADHAHKTVDGGYTVKVETADGKTIIVTLDASFTVTGQQEVTGKGGKGGKDKIAVTDQEKTKASEAALVAVPGGTVLEVKKDRDGGFGVIVRTSDGVKKLVKLDSNYTLLFVQDAKGKGKGRHGKHGGQGTEVTGEAYTKAEAAALTAVPGGTVVDVHQKGTSYHVLVKKADGTKVLVTLDANFSVTDTKEFTMKTKSNRS